MELYREELLEHYKSTANKGSLADATAHVHESNPMCGDSLDLYLKVENGKIVDAKFEGIGCAISLASTSMLIDKIKGMSVEDAKKITKQEILEAINPNLTLSRIKCATLGLSALQKSLLEQ